MHKYATLSTLFAVILPVTAMAQPAPAEQPAADAPPVTVEPTNISTTGDFGVGGEGTAAGTTRLLGRYQVSHELGVFGALQLAAVTADGFTDRYGLGGGAAWRLRTSGNAAVAVVGRLDAARTSSSTGMVMSTVTTIALTAGIEGVWFVDRRISLHAQAGVSFAIFSGEQGMADLSGNAIVLGGDTLTTVAVTYWFR